MQVRDISGDPECGNDGWVIGQKTDYCYKSTGILLNFYETQALCNFWDGEMVSIADEIENEDIRKKTQGHSKHDVWLGLQKRCLGI